MIVDKTKCRIIFTISFILLFFILHPYCIGESIRQSTLTIEDFLIVEITEEDFTKQDIGTDITDPDKARYIRRKLHSIFVREFRDSGKCLILDFWYPDRGIKEIDRELINELHKSENVVIGMCGLYNGEVEYTHSSFLLASPYIGSTIFHKNEDKEIVTKLKGKTWCYLLQVNDDGESIKKQEIKEKYIALAAMDLLQLSYPTEREITIPVKALKEYKRIGYSEALADKKIGENKIIILIAQLKGQEDIHIIKGYGSITGPEIICSIIMYLANKAAPEGSE